MLVRVGDEMSDGSDDVGARLLDLQEADTAIDQLGHRRRTLPERSHLDTLIEAGRDLERRRAALVAERDAAAAEIAGCEAETAAIDAQRSRLAAQLRTVIAPREAEALQHEIATLEERRSGLDDRALIAMDTQGAAEASLAELDAGEAERTAELAAAKEALRAADGALDTELAALGERRDAARAGMPPEVIARYDPLRAKLGVAAARLVGSRCEGCHLDMSAAELDGVRRAPAGTIPECPQCGRLLVR